jgi:hypothetical protein
MIGIILSKEQIIRSIENKCGKIGYSFWTIGITDKPEELLRQYRNDGKSITCFEYWFSDSEEDAISVKKYFEEKGMNFETNGEARGKFVYLY